MGYQGSDIVKEPNARSCSSIQGDDCNVRGGDSEARPKSDISTSHSRRPVKETESPGFCFALEISA